MIKMKGKQLKLPLRYWGRAAIREAMRNSGYSKDEIIVKVKKVDKVKKEITFERV